MVAQRLNHMIAYGRCHARHLSNVPTRLFELYFPFAWYLASHSIPSLSTCRLFMRYSCVLVEVTLQQPGTSQS